MNKQKIHELPDMIVGLRKSAYRDIDQDIKSLKIILSSLLGEDDRSREHTEEEVRKSFVSIWGRVVDYLDILLGYIEVIETLDGKVVTEKEDGRTPIEILRKYGLEKARNRGLSVYKKFKSIGIDKDEIIFSKVDGYIKVRNIIEHHKSIPEEDVDIYSGEYFIIINGSRIDITDMPIKFKKGDKMSNSLDLKEVVLIFPKDQQIILNDKELESLSIYLKDTIIPQIEEFARKTMLKIKKENMQKSIT